MNVQKNGSWIEQETENEITVSSAEEKVSPNADLVIKKYYKKCDHTTKEYVELPKEMINLTQEELEKQYKEFEVESFSSNEVVLIKEEEGYCNEHYLVRTENGRLVIYQINEAGDQKLYERTEISTEYLPQVDMSELEQGIKVYGKEELNSLLENFE